MKKTMLIEVISTIEELENKLKTIDSNTEKIDYITILEELKEDAPDEIVQSVDGLKLYLQEYEDIDEILIKAKREDEEIEICTINNLMHLQIKMGKNISDIDEAEDNVLNIEKIINQLERRKNKITKKLESDETLTKRMSDISFPIKIINFLLIPIVAAIFNASFSVFLITYLLISYVVPIIMNITIKNLSNKFHIKRNEEKIKYNEKIIKLMNYIITRYNVERLFKSFLILKEMDKIQLLSTPTIETLGLDIDNLKEARYNEPRINEEVLSEDNNQAKVKKRIRRKNKSC